MSTFTTWENNIDSNPQKETLEKHQRDIFNFSDVNLSKKECIDNSNASDLLYCI